MLIFLFVFRQGEARRVAAVPGERLPGPGDQGPPGDLAADALDRAQHHHVRRLQEPVVHVQAPARAHPT